MIFTKEKMKKFLDETKMRNDDTVIGIVKFEETDKGVSYSIFDGEDYTKKSKVFSTRDEAEAHICDNFENIKLAIGDEAAVRPSTVKELIMKKYFFMTDPRNEKNISDSEKIIDLFIGDVPSEEDLINSKSYEYFKTRLELDSNGNIDITKFWSNMATLNLEDLPGFDHNNVDVHLAEMLDECITEVNTGVAAIRADAEKFMTTYKDSEDEVIRMILLLQEKLVSRILMNLMSVPLMIPRIAIDYDLIVEK